MSPRALSRQLTVGYLLALTSVAVLSLGSFVALGTVIRTEARRAGQINLSGRQRMLTQRIALDGQQLAERLTPAERRNTRSDLAEAIKLMRGAHLQLVDGGGPRGSRRGLSSGRLRSVYLERPTAVDARTRAFLTRSSAVLARSQGRLGRADPDRQAVLAAARGPLRDALNAAVTAFERESADDVGRLERISGFVLVATLAVLGLEALLVFRPLAARIRRRTEQLAVAEGRLRAVAENAMVGVLTLSGDGGVLSANATAARLFGREPAQLAGRSVLELMASRAAREKLASLMAEALADRPLPACELAIARTSGESFTAEVAVTAARTPGDVTLVALVTDVTERKSYEAELSHRALHDTLTGLPNRVLLHDRLAQARARLLRSGGQLALLFIDLDRFKAVNDTLGHEAGDHLLITVARRLEAVLRGTDTLARFGGDEFLVLSEGCATEQDAERIADRILAALSEPVELPGGRTALIGASIGIALSVPSDGDSAEALIQDADAAMYHAKRRGTGGHELFDASWPRHTQRRLREETALQRAIAEGELELHYQPVVRLQTLEVTGYEALVRWRHPELGLVLPGDFIPMAEETGLVLELGEWVIGKACRQAGRWRGMAPAGPPLTMAVNVAAAQLESPTLLETVRRALADDAVDPGEIRLGIEITERTMARDPDRVRATLHELKALGVSVSLDDFGTGYSSLAHLKRFSFDVLKIDRTFVSGLGGPTNDGLIAEAVIGLGGALGLTIVAEGVETDAELARLGELGCALGQGYLFARPLPADEIAHPRQLAALPLMR